MHWNSIGKCTAAFALAIGLAACGGTDRSNDDSDNGNQPPPHRPDLYQASGLHPDSLGHGARVDEAVKEAVAPGYIAFGALMASLELRMGLQAFAWFIPDHAPLVSREGATDEAPYPNRTAIACDGYHGGSAMIYARESQERYGEEIVFGFNDCSPSGEPQLSSDGDIAQPRVQRHTPLASQHHRFELGAAILSTHPEFKLSGGPVEYQGDAEAMLFTNASPDGSQTSTSLGFAGQSEGAPTVWIQGADRGATQASELHSHKPDTHIDVLRIDTAHFNVYLERDEAAAAGSYVLSSEQMDLRYRHTPLQLAAGGFSVESEDGTVYTYTVDADPAHLHVTIDYADEDQESVSGRMSQSFVINRLALE